MTRDEALEKLTAPIVRDHLKERLVPAVRAAIDVAIEALQEPEIVRCKNCMHKIRTDMAEIECAINDEWVPKEADDFCSYGEKWGRDDRQCNDNT